MSAATIIFSESNGAGPTVTDGIGNLNFGSADVHDLVIADHPVVHSAFTSRYSFHKNIRAKVSSIGTSNQITNFTLWRSAGALAAGENILSNFDSSNYYPTSYHTPTAAPVSDVTIAALPLSEPGAAANISIDAVGTPDSGAPAAPAGVLTGVGYSQYAVMILQIASGFTTPPPGGTTLATKTLTLRYDES